MLFLTFGCSIDVAVMMAVPVIPRGVESSRFRRTGQLGASSASAAPSDAFASVVPGIDVETVRRWPRSMTATPNGKSGKSRWSNGRLVVQRQLSRETGASNLEEESSDPGRGELARTQRFSAAYNFRERVNCSEPWEGASLARGRSALARALKHDHCRSLRFSPHWPAVACRIAASNSGCLHSLPSHMLATVPSGFTRTVRMP